MPPKDAPTLPTPVPPPINRRNRGAIESGRHAADPLAIQTLSAPHSRAAESLGDFTPECLTFFSQQVTFLQSFSLSIP